MRHRDGRVMHYPVTKDLAWNATCVSRDLSKRVAVSKKTPERQLLGSSEDVVFIIFSMTLVFCFMSLKRNSRSAATEGWFNLSKTQAIPSR
jgi:hypothetical protein